MAAIETDPDMDVLIVERAPEGEHGGNSRYTDAYMRLEEDGSPVEEFIDDFRLFSEGSANYDIVRTLRDEAKATIEWVESHDVEFEAMQTMFLTSNRPRLLPKGGGLAIVEALLGDATDRGVDVSYETTAERIVRSDDREIAGLRIRDGDGTPELIEADAILIASGGFEGSQRMLAEYVGGDVVDLDPLAKGGEYNKGDGIEMAVDIGGGTSGSFEKFHATPVDPRSDAPGPSIHAFPYGILINKKGDRFLDEARKTVDEHYEAVARRIWDQPDRTAYLIYDQKLHDIPDVEYSIGSEVEPYAANPNYSSDADPLESVVTNLAEQIDVEAASLLETIEEFNGSVRDGEFVPTELDGKQATADPPKSNWAQPLDTPPFECYPLTCANVFTFGGIATDTDARVLSTDDRPIPGLYAAGEVTGLYFQKYVGATSVLRSLVFDRRGGKHAASWA